MCSVLMSFYCIQIPIPLDQHGATRAAITRSSAWRRLHHLCLMFSSITSRCIKSLYGSIEFLDFRSGAAPRGRRTGIPASPPSPSSTATFMYGEQIILMEYVLKRSPWATRATGTSKKASGHTCEKYYPVQTLHRSDIHARWEKG